MEELANYINIVTMGICLCSLYIIKSVKRDFPKKWIPLTLLTLGVIIEVIEAKNISVEILLTGMLSGLASIGVYKAFQKWINSGNINDLAK